MSARRIAEAIRILVALGLPREQQNERSALCLLALIDLGPRGRWPDAQRPLVGITPIMDWARLHYRKAYAPNTRETFRRQTMHQFVAAGIALYNPDDDQRPVNSPKAVYQISPAAWSLLRTFGSPVWERSLRTYLSKAGSLAASYAKARELRRIPVQCLGATALRLSPGSHSALIRQIIEEFAPRFAPGSELLYVGDTGSKWAHCERDRLAALGITVDTHGKMPDVVLFFPERSWLLLIESVTSHGPVNGKRHRELANLFASATVGCVYVTAFPDRTTMARHVVAIAWETEVWVADAPSHLIHFNGERFLGPY